jgi:DNA-binding transcriptional regulator YbjK
MSTPEALRLADLLETDGWPDAAAELRRLHEVELNAQDRVERLYVLYQQASRQRDELLDQQRAQIAAMGGRMQ